jgi:exosortase
MSEATANRPNHGDRFRDEFLALWRRLPDKGLFFGLLGVWMLLFLFLGNSTFGYVDSPSLFMWMHNAYSYPNSEDSHGYLIPAVVLALFWWKREQLMAVPKGVWGPGLVFLGLSIVLHIGGYLIQQPRVSIVAMFAGGYALLALVWGWPFAKASFFPYVLFGFCVPLGGLLDPITVPLRQVSTDLAVFASRNMLGIPILQDGVQIIDPQGHYAYEVAAACSGIRSLITFLALTTIYGFVSFTTPWKRLVIVSLTLPLALAGNVIRLLAIIVAAEAFGQKAGHFVHEWFGFVSFLMALAVMLGVGHWLREPLRPYVGGMTPRTA